LTQWIGHQTRAGRKERGEQFNRRAEFVLVLSLWQLAA
jgi:hypothetical protein